MLQIDKKTTEQNIIALVPLPSRLSLGTLLLSAIALLTTTNSSAINPNSTAPIQIESDMVTFDDQNGFSQYSGNVVVKQGKTRLEAEKIIVSVKDRQILSIEATGQPAHFVEADLKDTETHGYAKSISYITSSALLTLQGAAKLNQREHSFSGDRIVYDTRNKSVHASGNKAEGERVIIQFQPAPQPPKSTSTGTAPQENLTVAEPKNLEPSVTQPDSSPPNSLETSNIKRDD